MYDNASANGTDVWRAELRVHLRRHQRGAKQSINEQSRRFQAALLRWQRGYGLCAIYNGKQMCYNKKKAGKRQKNAHA